MPSCPWSGTGGARDRYQNVAEHSGSVNKAFCSVLRKLFVHRFGIRLDMSVCLSVGLSVGLYVTV